MATYQITTFANPRITKSITPAVIYRKRIDAAKLLFQRTVYNMVRQCAMLDRPAGAKAIRKARDWSESPLFGRMSLEVRIPNGPYIVRVEKIA